MGWVLLVCVLAVVQEQVCLVRQRVARDPLRLQLLQRTNDRRLVVRQIAERESSVLDPESERRASMGDGLRSNPSGTYPPLAYRAVLEIELARQLPDLDRRKRSREVAPDAVAKRNAWSSRPPDRDL